MKDKLRFKAGLLRHLKTFYRYDWSEDILRLTREVKEMERSLSARDLIAWRKEKKKADGFAGRIRIIQVSSREREFSLPELKREAEIRAILQNIINHGIGNRS